MVFIGAKKVIVMSINQSNPLPVALLSKNNDIKGSTIIVIVKII